MWYQKTHVGYYDAETWYNKLHKHYATYHRRLDQREWGLFVRYLPRNLHGAYILDLGAGDGRMAKYIVDTGIARYDALDIAADLLARAPRWTHHIHHDFNAAPWPCDAGCYDVVLSFFAIGYVEDLDAWYSELARVVKPGGVCIVQHHKERREFVHKVDGEQFKIASHGWSQQDLEKAAALHVFEIYQTPIPDDQWGGTIYCFMLP